jgi:hypothetical protein
VILNYLLPSILPEKFQFFGKGDSLTRELTYKLIVDLKSDQSKSLSVIENLELNSNEFLTNELSSSNGVGDAQSMAKLANLVANGGELFGVKLFSKETYQLLTSNPTKEIDYCLFRNTTFYQGGVCQFENTIGIQLLI